jgi:catechol 2,3-dioxygenase-like lactoylglutathione lyase family enzyme
MGSAGSVAIASLALAFAACGEDSNGTRRATTNPDAAAERPSLCSGCAERVTDPADPSVHLHHVHLNSAARQRSTHFYQEHLSAEPVRLNDVTDALLAAPILLLTDERDVAPVSALPTTLQHVGWGSSDVQAWYDRAHEAGVAADTRGFTLFMTAGTPVIGEPGSGQAAALGEVPACFPLPDALSYIYVLGPDQERIEVWSGVDQRVNHVHFTSSDLEATATWFQQFLGTPPLFSPVIHAFYLDDVLFFFEKVGAPEDYGLTDDRVLGHIAFSVTDLAAWRQRAGDRGVEIVAEPAAVHGFQSFFVRGPDGLLVEIVQAAPLPGLCPGGR